MKTISQRFPKGTWVKHIGQGTRTWSLEGKIGQVVYAYVDSDRSHYDDDDGERVAVKFLDDEGPSVRARFVAPEYLVKLNKKERAVAIAKIALSIP